MEKYNLIKELRALQIRSYELKGEIAAFLKARAERLREFSDGEVVSVYGESGNFISNGIVGNCFIMPFGDLDIKTLSENKDKYLFRINEVRYKVFAIKKDGTASTRNVTHSNSLTSDKKVGWHYIQKIKSANQ